MKKFKKQFSEKLVEIGYHVNEAIHLDLDEGHVRVYKQGKYICTVNYSCGKFQKSNFYTPDDIVKIINEYGDN